MSQVLGIFYNAITITAFVVAMMIAVEYLNILTRGSWRTGLGRRRWTQLILASLLGAVPGCLGPYVLVALYAHRSVSFGALVAAMIATSGDEAFVMLALFPKDALVLTLALVVLAVLAGRVVDLITKDRTAFDACQEPVWHDEIHCQCLPPLRQVMHQMRHMTATRGVLSISLGLYLVAQLTTPLGHSHTHSLEMALGHGPAQQEKIVPVAAEEEEHHDEPDPWSWVNITLALISLLALLIILTVPEHFLQEHLWRHTIREHGLRIFLWTLGALAVITVMLRFVDLMGMVQGAPWLILVLAGLIGLVPESGPHLIFVILFAQGQVPPSVLVTSSIVQDGHGTLPLLAHSRKDFLLLKVINLAVGLAVGAMLMSLGW